jgi:thimet oligopeptidase
MRPPIGPGSPKTLHPVPAPGPGTLGMTTSLAPVLGEFPFTLGPAELERRADLLLVEAAKALDEIEGRGGTRTVENTLTPLDDILRRVADLSSHASLVFNTHPDPAQRDAGRKVSEASERFFTAFRIRRATYDALTIIAAGPLDAEARHALERLLREMRRAGVQLDEAGRARVQALNDEIDVLGNQFQENINRLTRTLEVTGSNPLVGLPPDYVAAHAPDDHGVIRITTQYPDAGPVLLYADDPDLRRRMQHESLNVAYPENIAVLHQVLDKRNQMVRLLGYRNFADYATEDKMIGSAEAARAFITDLGERVQAPAREHVQRVLARKRRDFPDARAVDLWDGGAIGGYYDRKLRQEDFGVDLKLLRDYFPYPRVRDGLFSLCTRLFGVRIVPAPSEGLWHPTVDAYDMFRGSETVGRFYLDMVPREGKYNHAAHFTIRIGIGGVQLPQSALICNFLDPSTPKDEVRMEYSQVVTFFHEFGHLVHSLLSGQGRWLYNGMGFVERDFIEAPSQLFEEWARDPATLKEFAAKADGTPAPDELLQRLKDSAGLGRAGGWAFQAGLSSASLGFHDRDPDGVDLDGLFHTIMASYMPVEMPRDTHLPASWGHLIGYSACYYTYAWSAVVARDFLSLFLARGSLTDPELAGRYAAKILAPGGTRPAAELVRDFLGREMSPVAFQQWILDDPYRRREAGRPGSG